MKKILSLLLSALFLLSVAPALAEEAAFVAGGVREILEDGSLLLSQFSGGDILVKIDENTRMELDYELTSGVLIGVTYNGIMTRSLPPQITAEAIYNHTLEGLAALDNLETNRLLVETLEHGPVYVTLSEDENAADYGGKWVQTVYNGIMLMSLPPRAYAVSIREVAMDSGTVTEMGTEYLMLEGQSGAVRVNFDVTSKISENLEVGEQVTVVYSGAATLSLPPQIHGIAVMRISVFP